MANEVKTVLNVGERLARLVEPQEPTADPLVMLLRFVEALDGHDVFAPVDPVRVFEKMRREIPNLTPIDLVFAGGVATQLGKQCRSASWKLRGKRKLPKPPRARLRRRPNGPDDPN